ncbi:MAG TPA: radical SAM protein [Spirochaetota bacterium]|nr:radical SAM protein [Spirochaetota bacterium]
MQPKHNLNILLIEPSSNISFTGGSPTPPQWPAVLSALTPENHSLDYIHTAFEEVDAEKIKSYDLIGISVRTDTAMQAYSIGDMCKINNIPSIMGGVHAFIQPDDVKKHCDSIVFGEAEYLWQKILKDVAKGKLKKIYQAEKYTESEDYVTPALNIFNKYNYKLPNVLETGRGCPNNCDFCISTIYCGKKIRFKPINSIIKEINSWKDKKSLTILADLNISSNLKKSKELFRRLIPYNLSWWGYASVRVAEDEELLKLMSDSGCMYLGIGFESISQQALKDMNKKKNYHVDYKKLIKKIHSYNIDIFGNFIFGLDSDTSQVFKNTVNFVLETGIDFPVFQILVPYPGTKLFDRLDKQNRILTKDWSQYCRCNVVFEPKNMTVKELMDGTIEAYETSYSLKNRALRRISRWRGIKKQIYNSVLLSHFIKNFASVKNFYNKKYTSSV